MLRDNNLAKEPQLLILLLLVSFPSVSTVLFTPALPQIAGYFDVTTSAAQLSVTLFLVGFALGQLPYGPLANRFGRKRPLQFGLILAIASSLLCVLAGTIQAFWLLVAARLFMGLGSAAGLKIVFTIVGDVYQPPRSTKIFSYAVLAYAIMPGIGTFIGGLLTQRFGWQSCFYFLGVYGLLLLSVSNYLPETCRIAERIKLNWETISEGYKAKFKNHILVACAVILGLRTSFIYCFAAKAPFLATHQIGITPEEFGVLSLIPPAGMVIGTFFAVKMANKVSGVTAILSGVGIALVGTIGMLVPFVFGNITVLSLFIPMFLIDIGLSIVYGNASSIGLAHAKNISNGSAVMNFINLSLSVVWVLAIGLIQPDQATILPILFGMLVLVMIYMLLRLKNLLQKVPHV